MIVGFVADYKHSALPYCKWLQMVDCRRVSQDSIYCFVLPDLWQNRMDAKDGASHKIVAKPLASHNDQLHS